jgi:hypothetical protein
VSLYGTTDFLIILVLDFFFQTPDSNTGLENFFSGGHANPQRLYLTDEVSNRLSKVGKLGT